MRMIYGRAAPVLNTYPLQPLGWDQKSSTGRRLDPCQWLVHAGRTLINHPTLLHPRSSKLASYCSTPSGPNTESTVFVNM